MDEYFYPEEVNPDTKTLRRSITYGPDYISLRSELTMEFTDEELDEIGLHLHRLWRRARLRHKNRKTDEFLSKNPLVQKERALWAEWVEHRKSLGLDPNQISQFRKWEKDRGP